MTWASLRAVGNLRVLKVSYLVLMVVPLLSKYQDVTQLLGLSNWLMVTLFSASFALALANLVYDIACPAIIKRFASPNDLYARMLEIRYYSKEQYPGDNFDASLGHCKKAYVSKAYTARLWRWACTVFFVVSAIGFGIIFAYRGYVVFSLLL